MKRKFTATITKVKRQTVLSQATNLRVHCPACERDVETLNRSQASEILGVCGQELEEFIAAGHVHAIKTISGSLRVCKDSLF